MSTLAPGSGPSASVAGGPVRARTLRQRLGGPQGRNWWFLVFVAPFIIGLALFVYIPVNGGMIAGLLPVVGVPMPLISYGGTAAVSLLAGFGLVMAARVHRPVHGG